MPQLVLLRPAEFAGQPAAEDIPRWPPILRLAFIVTGAAVSWGALIGVAMMVGRFI